MIRISFLCIEPLRKPFFMRAADVDDLILNTLGGTVGCGIHAPARRRAEVRRPQETESEE